MENLLDYRIIKLSNYTLSVGNLLLVLIILAATWTVLFLFKKILSKSNRLDAGQKYSLFQIIKYIVWVFAFAYCFESLGVKFTFLLAGSAALMVGLGLGLQQTFNDFVSGFILLLEGTLKVGDIVEVDGTVVRVMHIGLRTTKVISRDDITLILPNNVLTNQRVINWSHASEKARFSVQVGVDYGSDVELVKTILLDSATSHPKIEDTPAPFVRFENFGDSSLDFSIFFWSHEIFPIENIKSEIRFNINKKFRENGVTIPFPQRVVHITNNPEKQ